MTAGWETLRSRFDPFPTTAETFGHPPLGFELAALVWFLLPREPWALRLLALSFGAITLLATYLIGRALWHGRVAIAATALLALCPLFFAQVGLLQLDLVATAFGSVAVCGLLRRRQSLYVVSASLMTLSKETSVLFIPLMGAYAWFDGEHLAAPSRTKSVVLTVSPILAFASWVALHKGATGFWWGDQLTLAANTEILRANLEMGILKRFMIRWIQVLDADHTYVIGLAFLLAMVKGWTRNRGVGRGIRTVKVCPARNRAAAFMMAAVLVFMAFHSVLGVLHPRYLLPVFPLLFLLVAQALDYVFGQKMFWAVAVIVPIFVLAWFQAPGRFSAPEASLDYVRIVKAHQAAAVYLEQHERGCLIAASAFQSGANLTNPLFGYVRMPLRVTPVAFEYHATQARGLPLDLVYLASSDQFRDQVQDLIAFRNLTEFKRFQFGRHFVALYR